MERPGGLGRLTLVGTPIGNLADASLRLRGAFREADIIAAEDTRVTRSLMNKLKVHSAAKLVSVNEHNEADKAGWLLDEVEGGACVVAVVDAGMPAISDPGYRLVAQAHERNLKVTSVPGPSAVITAVALSGLPTDRFTFEGFIRRKQAQRVRQFEELRHEPRTLVFFESPHRLAGSLRLMSHYFGASRQAAVVREITKIFEEVLRDSLDALAARAETFPPKGEIVIVVQGAPAGPRDITREILAEVRRLQRKNVGYRDAVRIIAEKYGLNKRELYGRGIDSPEETR